MIAIFGMSIGETDKMWWQYIAEWLREDHNKRLIIYAHRTGGKHEIFDAEDRMLEKFKNNGTVSDEVWGRIRAQICVVINAKIFNFRLV